MKLYEALHRAIHGTADSVTIDGVTHPIQKAQNGCRFIIYEDTQFIQQNTKKRTSYAKRAANGERITWGIKQGKWIYIDDNGIKQ